MWIRLMLAMSSFDLFCVSEMLRTEWRWENFSDGFIKPFFYRRCLKVFKRTESFWLKKILLREKISLMTKQIFSSSKRKFLFCRQESWVWEELQTFLIKFMVEAWLCKTSRSFAHCLKFSKCKLKIFKWERRVFYLLATKWENSHAI